jgi:hypothetical protein
MRRDTSKPSVDFGARLPRAEKLVWEGRLPGSGGKTFFVAQAIEWFCEAVEGSRDLHQACKVAIQQMLDEKEQLEGLEYTNVAIPTVLYERFQRLFPAYGATTWFFRAVVRAFIAEDDLDFSLLVKEAVYQVTASVLAGVKPGSTLTE